MSGDGTFDAQLALLLSLYQGHKLANEVSSLLQKELELSFCGIYLIQQSKLVMIGGSGEMGRYLVGQERTFSLDANSIYAKVASEGVTRLFDSFTSHIFVVNRSSSLPQTVSITQVVERIPAPLYSARWRILIPLLQDGYSSGLFELLINDLELDETISERLGRWISILNNTSMTLNLESF